jgi:Family of unknown function (DUF6130)
MGGRVRLRSPMGYVAVVLGLTVAACGGAASGGDPGTTSPSATSSSPRPSSPAMVTIVSPVNDGIVRGSSVDVRVELEGATIVPQTTTDVRPDEGHLHLFLDDQLVSMTEGLEQTVPDVAPGLHRITVEFVAADHAPFDPRVVAVVTFEVRA